VPERSFHHGDLRRALLSEASRTLREDGLAALSLRELARRTGVSHGSPRRHFPDRQALLDALAEEGFRSLTGQMRDSTGPVARLEEQFRAGAEAFVGFALAEPALMELMFTVKNDNPSPGLRAASEDFYVASAELFGRLHAQGRLALAHPDRARMLLAATLQGIATLVGAGRLPVEDVDNLLHDAAAVFILSPAAATSEAGAGHDGQARNAAAG